MARPERRFHRQLAAVSAVLVIWFAASGLVLNHAADLALHERPLPRLLVTAFYRAELPANLSGYQLDGHPVTVIGEHLYHDTQAVDRCAALRGAGVTGELHVVACTDAVHVLDADGNRLDRIDGGWGLTGDIQALGRLPDTPDGTARIGIATTEGTWCLAPATAVLSACSDRVGSEQPAPLPAGIRTRLANSLGEQDVDVERFLHDLHTGRLFGDSARWVWDIFALALLILAGSGIAMLRRSSRP